MIRFAAIGLLCILGVLIYWFSDTARARSVSSVFDHLVNGSSPIDQAGFEKSVLRSLNEKREALGLASLSTDPEISDALGRMASTRDKLAEVELESLFQALRAEFPSAQFLSATIQLNPSDEGLVGNLHDWEDADDPRYQTLSTLIFRDGLRKGCLAVLARKLPVFDLELANQGRGPFFQTCPHCEATHSVTLEGESRSVILSCPACQLPYDLLAADSLGRIDRAPRFFEGFQIPGFSDSSGNPEDTLRKIWATVLSHCTYRHDTANGQGVESWKRPSETWRDAEGDCEDTSILLADALLSAGIDARVAVGWNTHIGEHAWCVARIGDQQWILESTLQREDESLPTLRKVADGASEYRPEKLFDREALYFREGRPGGQRDCSDYWSAEDWRKLVQQ